MAAVSLVDNYQIIRKLGAGGYAKVKLARDLRDQTLVALKIMRLDRGPMSQRYLVQLQSETLALNRLNHPSIVRIFNTSQKATYKSKSSRQFPVAYIAMELLPNGELFDVISYTGKMEAPIARVYFRQLLDAVGICHENGITHRDLKPENILFDEQFNLKIADFGFAGPTQGRDGSGLLRTQLGTEAYVVPEILLDRPYSGVSADLFACGHILFILVSGHPAFEKAKAEERYYGEFIRRNDYFWELHSRGKPQNFYTAEFKALINAMLAYDSAQRPTLQQVLNSPWLNGPTLSVQSAQVEIAQRHAQMQIMAQQANRRAVVNVHAGVYRGDLGDSAGSTLGNSSLSDSQSSSTGQKTLSPFIEGTHKFSRLYLTLPAERIMFLLSTYLKESEAEVLESERKFKLRVKIVTESDSSEMRIELFDTAEGSICVEFLKTGGSAHKFVQVFAMLKEELEKANSAE